MARIITIIILGFFFQASNLNGQKSNLNHQKLSPHASFEGAIIYSMKYESTDFSPKMVKEYFGDTVVYTYKEDHYKSVMNGSLQLTTLYNGGDTIFFPMEGAKGVSIAFASKEPCEIIDYKIEKNVAKILDLQCNLLTITTNEGYIKYYYNQEYPLSPNYFSKLKYGLIGFCIEKTHSVPLRMITKEGDIFVDIQVVQIRNYDVSWDQFEVPEIPRLYKPWEKWKKSSSSERQ